MSQRPDALIATIDAVTLSQLHEVIDFLESNRIPTMFSDREYVLARRVSSLAFAMFAAIRLASSEKHDLDQRRVCVCVSKYRFRAVRGINPIGEKQWQDLMI